MNRASKLTAIAATTAIGLTAGIGGVAVAGKKGSVKYNDETSKGSLYEPGIYAACDIKKLSASEKRNKITLNVNYRGSSKVRDDRSAIDTVYFNAKGAKKSDPEYQTATYDDGLHIFKRKHVANPEPGYPDYELVDTGKVAKLSHKDKKDAVKIPVNAFGKTKKVGLQVQTCGEGAVDIAPGKNYFDDTGYDGTIKFQFLSVKV